MKKRIISVVIGMLILFPFALYARGNETETENEDGGEQAAAPAPVTIPGRNEDRPENMLPLDGST